MTDLPNSGQTDSMDNVAVTREDFRQDIGEFLQYTAQALGNITGTYTTETIDPTQVILRGTPTLAAGAEASASDVTLRLANTRWVKYNANSRGTAAPSNPVDGQTWVDISVDPPVLKIWDETNLVWAESSGGSSVDTGATPPTSPSDGDMWWNTDDGRLYIYYTDADSSQWVDASPDSKIEEFWQRTGTTISPKTAGDDVQLNSLNGGQLAGMRNRIINGSMAISQRGTVTGIGGTNFPAYTLDRWLYDRTGLGSSTISQGTNTDFGERNYLETISALAAGETLTIEQRIEANNCTDLAGQTVTVSYTVSGADSTGAPFALSRCVLTYATAGVDDWATETQVGFFDFPVTGTATRITHTFNVPGAATNGLKLQFVVEKSGATGDVTINLGTVQLEPGPVATPFEHRPIGTELALCQRYYQQSWTGDATTGVTTDGDIIACPLSNAAGQLVGTTFLRQTMRATPTLTEIGSSTLTSGWALVNASGTPVAKPGILAAKSDRRTIKLTVSVSGASTGQAYNMIGNWTASAEL